MDHMIALPIIGGLLAVTIVLFITAELLSVIHRENPRSLPGPHGPL